MFDATELLDRFVALEKEALASVNATLYGDVDALPRWFAASERLPYWTNALASVTPEYSENGYGEEAQLYVAVVWARLVFAHVTAGQTGEVDDNLMTAIPTLIQYFDRRAQLQSAAYPAPMSWLEAPGVTLQLARFNPQMTPTVSGGIPVGFEFQWRCPFLVLTEQQYLG